MPKRENLTFAYNLNTKTYHKLPPPPVRPQYTQGACDGDSLYVVGGRGSGQRVLKLTRNEQKEWQWSDMPSQPEEEGDGRWLATVSLVGGKWLIVVAGTPTGAPSEKGVKPQLADYRLDLKRPQAGWQRIATYPVAPARSCSRRPSAARCTYSVAQTTIPSCVPFTWSWSRSMEFACRYGRKANGRTGYASGRRRWMSGGDSPVSGYAWVHACQGEG